MLTLIRFTLRILPAPLRERLAVRLFVTCRDHGERPRETAWRKKGQQVLVGGCHAVAFGAPEAPVALLMHGWEGRGLQLCAFIEPLAERGYRVIAIDGPGHGKTPGRGGIPMFAAALEKAMEEHDVRLIVAHSLGAAASIVAAHRTQFGGQIIALGGPPETEHIFTRARAFLGLPESGRAQFMKLLMARYPDVRLDDILDMEGIARDWGGRIVGILANGDEEVPVEESRSIIEAAGGKVIVTDAGHRSVMWDDEAVQAALSYVKG